MGNNWQWINMQLRTQRSSGSIYEQKNENRPINKRLMTDKLVRHALLPAIHHIICLSSKATYSCCPFPWSWLALCLGWLLPVLLCIGSSFHLYNCTIESSTLMNYMMAHSPKYKKKIEIKRNHRNRQHDQLFFVFFF